TPAFPPEPPVYADAAYAQQQAAYAAFYQSQQAAVGSSAYYNQQYPQHYPSYPVPGTGGYPAQAAYDWSGYQLHQHTYAAPAMTASSLGASTAPSAPSATPTPTPTPSVKPFTLNAKVTTKPAYTLVKPRKLQESPLAQLSEQEAKPAPEKKADGYPPSLRSYVVRSQESCSAEDWPAAQKMIHALIVKVMNANALHSTDWDNMALPSVNSKMGASNLASESKKRKITATPANDRTSFAAKKASSIEEAYNASIPSAANNYNAKNAGSSPMDIDVPVNGSTEKPWSTRKHAVVAYSAKDPGSPAPVTKLKASKTKSKSPLVSSSYTSTPGSDDEDTSLLRLPPSQRNAELAKRQQRKGRFEGPAEEMARLKTEKDLEVKRAQAAFLRAGAEGNPDVIDWDKFTIIGTSTDLEKRYLRLTSAPDPSTVRPLHILRRTLDLLVNKWKEEQNYTYICDQFKSLRQDLTVQRIKNDLTVSVYETHARIALEKGDLGEYNQCQAQLLQLYKLHKLDGSIDEFTGYRILYLVHTSNRTELIKVIGELNEREKGGQSIKHALNVRTAIAIGDYHRLFLLYNTCPKMSMYLMDQFIERERFRAMKVMCRAYRETLPVAHIANELGFVDAADLVADSATEIARGRKACTKWLKGLTPKVAWVDNIANGSGSLTTRPSLATFAALVESSKMKGVDIKGQL
ncbi:hypothetical protein HKX48_001110, partial [Thoreauomyces humboldtii]